MFFSGIKGDHKKAINQMSLAGRRLMALKEVPEGFQPFETLFFFYRISPKKSSI
jgi:hypothetical protein